MRRLTLTVFLCLAACGGGARNPSTGAVDRSGDMRAAQEFLLTSDAGLVIAEFAKVYSPAQLDTCLAAYVDDFGGPSGLSEPVSKPDVKGLRSFLAQCLGSVPADARTLSAGSMRVTGLGYGP